MKKPYIPEKIPYCWNSRRWLTGAIDPRSCPYLTQGEVNCIGIGCGYYEERKPNTYITNKLKFLQEAFK